MKSITTLALMFLICLSGSLAQQCRTQMVPVPVCDNNALQDAWKGDKGDQGVPGKAGPAIKGPKGDRGVSVMGEKGERGENCNCGAFQREVERRLDTLEKEMVKSATTTTTSPMVDPRLVVEEGWTVFQRRRDGSQKFDLPWSDYKSGFGKSSGEFWLGLEMIHTLTARRNCRLRIDLQDFNDNQRYAEYSSFYVEGESNNYTLQVDRYNGNAGDSLQNQGAGNHDGQPFTTRDRDNDNFGSGNCATYGQHRGGGWWYNRCLQASLNAEWGRSVGGWTRIIWNAWKGNKEALKATTMKLRCG